MADGLRKEMTGFRNSLKSNRALAEVSLEYHRKIVACIKKKDASGASSALNEHIDDIRKEREKLIPK